MRSPTQAIPADSIGKIALRQAHGLEKFLHNISPECVGSRWVGTHTAGAGRCLADEAKEPGQGFPGPLAPLAVSRG
jgi:hypothetical protein